MLRWRKAPRNSASPDTALLSVAVGLIAAWLMNQERARVQNESGLILVQLSGWFWLSFISTLALAIDATSLGQRLVGLAVSVVYRGCAIPVAWVILPAGAKHAGRRAWLRLLRLLRPAIPRRWTVIVLADRGLSAPGLLRRITRLGWHPFWRINTGGSFRPAGAACWRPLTTFVPRPGTSGRGAGLAFTRHQGGSTLLARWEEGDKDPWLILTDLPPEASDAGW